MTTRDDMLFAVELSVRYHRRRASFLDRASTFMTAATLVMGAGAFLSLLGGGQTIIAQVGTAIVTVLGIIQIVYRVDSCAYEHRAWFRSWLDLLGDIQADPSPAPETVNEWVRRRYEIEKECVCEMRALEIDCFNRTTKALDRDAAPVPLAWYHRLFMQVFRFEGASA